MTTHCLIVAMIKGVFPDAKEINVNVDRSISFVTQFSADRIKLRLLSEQTGKHHWMISACPHNKYCILVSLV